MTSAAAPLDPPDPRPIRMLAAMLTSVAPPIYLLCAHAFDAPIVPAAFCCGLEGAELPALTAPLLLAATALGGMAAAVVLLIGAQARARRWIQVGSRLALVAAAILVVAAGARALRPEPTRWLDGLPPVGVLAPVSERPARTEPGRPWTWDESAVHEDVIAGTLISRVCNAHVCGLVIGRAQAGVGLWGEHAATVYADRPVVLRRDDRIDLWIAEQDGVRRALRDGEAVRVGAREVAAVSGPPRAWWIASLLGVSAAALALSAARRSDRRQQWIEQGVLATVRGNGWLELRDGSPPRRIDDAIAAGPAVLFAGAAGAHAYRGGGDRSDVVLHGERADLAAAAASHAAARRALAVALSLVAAAPLVAAARLGLVWFL